MNKNCTNDSSKLYLRNVRQIIKNILMPKNKNNTKLFTEYWKLASKKLHLQVSWSIENICLLENLEVVDDTDEVILNKRSEVKLLKLFNHENCLPIRK